MVRRAFCVRIALLQKKRCNRFLEKGCTKECGGPLHGPFRGVHHWHPSAAPATASSGQCARRPASAVLYGAREGHELELLRWSIGLKWRASSAWILGYSNRRCIGQPALLGNWPISKSAQPSPYSVHPPSRGPSPCCPVPPDPPPCGGEGAHGRGSPFFLLKSQRSRGCSPPTRRPRSVPQR